MPSVNYADQIFTRPLPPASDLALTARQALDRTDVELRPCPCGARMPLQVRLHLRSRTRPVFEGRWCCSPACLQARVAAAVRRETRRAPVRRSQEHRIPLGLLLLSSGVISRDELRRALHVQEGTGKKIGDVLTSECGVSESKVAEALATQWSCPMWNVKGAKLGNMASVAPRSILEATGLLPLRLFGNGHSDDPSHPGEHRLAVAFADAIDPQAVFALRWMHDMAVDAGVAPRTQWSEARAHLFSGTSLTSEEIRCSSLEEMQNSMLQTLKRLQPIETRWARVHEFFWMRLWLEPEALSRGPLAKEDVVDVVYRLPPSVLAAAHTNSL